MIAAFATLGVSAAAIGFLRHSSRRAALQDQMVSLHEASIAATIEEPDTQGDRKLIKPLLFTLAITISAFFLSLHTTILLAVALPAGVVLVKGHRERSSKEREKERLTFYLPLVMERIVMAVEAGLDVLPALHTVYSLELEGHEEVSKLDPVTKLLKDACDLAENGATLEQALKEIAARVESVAVKHAFIHLALAHRDGGELVQPLRELSDSTQLYYQESMEEMIAKLPVKATLPLVITFGGLIMCFLASPIVQILMMTSKAMLR